MLCFDGELEWKFKVCYHTDIQRGRGRDEACYHTDTQKDKGRANGCRNKYAKMKLVSNRIAIH